MIQFAAEGLWGRGIYFAENSSYSDNYAHTLPGNKERQMFLAEVILGDCVALEQDSSLRLPPPKSVKNSSLAVELYDSVQGTTGGSTVFIVYDNNKAYPSYLITYKRF